MSGTCAIIKASETASLAELAAHINAAHDRTESTIRSGIEFARETGELLKRAKALVPHGQWLPWLAAKVCLSPRQAQKYMRLASECPKCAPGAHLPSINAALAILSAPDATEAEVVVEVTANVEPDELPHREPVPDASDGPGPTRRRADRATPERRAAAKQDRILDYEENPDPCPMAERDLRNAARTFVSRFRAYCRGRRWRKLEAALADRAVDCRDELDQLPSFERGRSVEERTKFRVPIFEAFMKALAEVCAEGEGNG